MVRTLTLENIGPMKRAHIEFGDLTVFVGPQASGKSIVLQFLKLVADRGPVHSQLTKYGINWSGNGEQFLDAYFGEGMRGIWNTESRLVEDGELRSLASLCVRRASSSAEQVFMIPAQRVLALRRGWPRPFTDYDAGDPYTVRDFSEKLRTLVEQEFSGSAALFPQARRLKKELRALLTEQVFGGFGLRIDKLRSQQRLVLSREGDPLPYMVWSAGQREFVPLLLGLYWLMPPTKTPMRHRIQCAIIEEPEMGLHPRAVGVVLLILLELVARGYRVCVSTHSQQVLEMIWAVRLLRAAGAAPSDLLGLFGCRKSAGMKEVAEGVLNPRRSIRVYYFDRSDGLVRDISDLDADSESSIETEWGGLTEFSARANRLVAMYASGAA